MSRKSFLAVRSRVRDRARAAAMSATKPTIDRPSAWNPAASVYVRTRSGERVGETSSMTLSTYFACVTGIAADVAKVPAAAVRRLRPRGREVLYDHPATVLLDEAFNDELDAFTGRETVTAWALGWGNGYAIIERDGRGDPIGIYPVHPSRVVVRRDSADRRVYLVRTDDMKTKRTYLPVINDDMFHLRGPGSTDEGMSVFASAAESIGLALAAQSFAARFFGGDLTAGSAIMLKEPLGDEEFAAFKSELINTYTGPNAQRIFIGNGEASIQRLSVNPDEAQALEARQFSVPDVCRWFRRSPQKVGHDGQSKGWGTIDALNVADVNDCLMPWWVRWEKESKRKLLGVDRAIAVKHWVQALMRGENAARADYLQKRVLTGTMTPNEVREIEDEEPIDDPNADKLWMQGAMAPIDRLGREPAAPTPATFPGSPVDDEPNDPEEPGAPVTPSAEASAAPAPVDPPPPAAAPKIVALGRAFADAAARVVGKEAAAVARAITKQDAAFGAWAEKFYAGQRAYVADAFAPLVADLSDLSGWDATASAAALATFAAALWPDPVGRTAESYRTPEDALATDLAAAVRAAVTPKE